MKEMKTLKFPNQDEPYEIVDAKARDDKQDKLTGTAGNFVVIGDDGNATTKTIITASTNDITAGTTPLDTGSIYLVYE